MNLGDELCGLTLSWWSNSGRILDQFVNGETIRDLLIRKILKIRIKKGGIRYLKLNRAQQEY